MKTLPPLGSRIKYEINFRGTPRKATGKVIAYFDGYHGHDENNKKYWCEPCVLMQVDTLPPWWGYSDNRFAPPISEIELI